MTMQVKVCGMRDAQNIQEVARCGPHYMGFIFYSGSPRYVGDPFQLPAFNSRIKRVGVFVNASVEEVLRQVKTHGLEFVQLHGQETPEVCGQLKDSSVGVIKSFTVTPGFRFDVLNAYEGKIEYALFDSPGRSAGGNGTAFDWQMLKRYHQRIPFFLSGGVGPENVHRLYDLKHMNLHAIDVNSRVEYRPGLKNIQLVKELIDRVVTRIHES
jgi:phosphoribosylanthranilate isomerase